MDDIAVLVARYGLAAVFLFTFLENAGLPIPAFPVLMLAGAFASAQHTALPLVVGVAVAGALLADGIWYFVGRWRGKRVLDRLCRISFNPDACLERAVDGFHRRKSATILFAKFLPGVNTIMPPLAGVAAMPFFLFLLLD
ncbi:MAG TPA: DedA family protein, partial [Candidatus Methylomirabilis sp.]|nr:DedA family protein [Candidatus Methylomirabilis sp.]